MARIGLTYTSLEIDHFQIDSTGWEERILSCGTRVKENPEGDVIELTEGPYAGEQLFTYEAAIRETEKVGKCVPDEFQIVEIIRSADPRIDPFGEWNNPTVASLLDVRFPGYLHHATDSSIGANTKARWWVNSPDGTHAYDVIFAADGSGLMGSSAKTNGLSVRCIADDPDAYWHNRRRRN